MEVKAYFESNTERLERELTKLSFDWVTYFSEPWEPDNDLNLILHYGDMTDSTNLINIIQTIEPNEIYNLAAQSHVHTSFLMPD